MSFTDPKKLWLSIENLIEADRVRGLNRARILSLANGDPPFTYEEADQDRISTNVNFLEQTQILQRARQQFSNAFLKPENYFSISLDFGPRDRRGSWAKIMTRQINRIMKRSAKYNHGLESKFAGVVLHGIGPALWFRERDWCPKVMGVEDVLVPTHTTQDLDNLDYFAVYQTFTPAQLIRQATGKHVDKGWNQSLVKRAISKMTEQVGMPNNVSDMDTYDFPEKAVEEFKINGGYWGSDAVPVLRCYDFYYLDTAGDPKDPKWRRKIVLDQTHDQWGIAGREGTNTVLYDGKDKDYGTDISRLMHVQFADGSVKPPFLWHSVRSLGYLLYAVCHLSNRINCKFSDAVFEHMLWYFRNVTSGDMEKIEKIDLHHLGVIPEGLQWVPPNERHTVDFNLVSGYMGMLRQKMQEHSSSFVRDTDQTPQREPETATAIMARVTTSNALIGSMLNRAYTYEAYSHREILRRFCVLKHPDCLKFRKKCTEEGVPEEIFQRWDDMDVIPERVLGAGNKMLGIAQADRLMAVRPLLDPEQQRRVTHIYVEESTDDPLLANELVPLEGPLPSQGESVATLAWGTLIDAKPVVVPPGISRVDYVNTLIALLASDIQRINEAGGTPDLERIQGLANVIQHLDEQVAILMGDRGIDERTKQYKDILGKAQNELKGYMQRLREAMEAAAEQQIDPETMAKINGQIALNQVKAAAMQQQAELKMQIAQAKFAADQQRKNVQTAGNEQRKNVQVAGDQQRQNLRLQGDLMEQSIRTQADVEATDISTAADVEATRKKAAAANSNSDKS